MTIEELKWGTGKKCSLNGTKGFVYLGEDNYGIKGFNNYVFACIVEDTSRPCLLPEDLWVYPIEKNQLIVKEDNIMSKNKQYPFHRMTFLDKDYEEFYRLIKNNKENN